MPRGRRRGRRAGLRFWVEVQSVAFASLGQSAGSRRALVTAALHAKLLNDGLGLSAAVKDGPSGRRFAVAARSLTAPDRRAPRPLPRARRRIGRVKGRRAAKPRALDASGPASTIETRLCVSGTVTKADPRPLAGFQSSAMRARPCILTASAARPATPSRPPPPPNAPAPAATATQWRAKAMRRPRRASRSRSGSASRKRAAGPPGRTASR
jgi:hypothetical protein